MSGYSTIKAMGLNDLDSISHHVLSTSDNQDVLKVYFKTPDDSALPDSCSFYFEHSASDARDPALLAAIDELSLLAAKQSSSEHKDRLVNDLEKLESVMASKLKELREGLSQFD